MRKNLGFIALAHKKVYRMSRPGMGKLVCGTHDATCPRHCFRDILNLIPNEIKHSSKKTTLEIELLHGRRIVLKSGEAPDSMIGRPVYSVVFDEYGSMNPECWQLVRPALSDTLGSALFIGTPRGNNHLFDLYESARKEESRTFTHILNLQQQKAPL